MLERGELAAAGPSGGKFAVNLVVVLWKSSIDLLAISLIPLDYPVSFRPYSSFLLEAQKTVAAVHNPGVSGER